MYLKLMDSNSPPNIQNVGKIMNVNKDNGTVTVKIPLTITFAPGTMVLLNVYMAHNIIIDAEQYYNFGEKGFSSKRVPINTNLTIYYKNNSGSAKSLNWKIGYYYGNV